MQDVPGEKRLTPKKFGCCSICDKQCFDLFHNKAGDLTGVGDPREDAIRAGLLLTNGTITDMTFCEQCSPHIEANVADIWARMMLAYAVQLRQAEAAAPDAKRTVALRQDTLRMANLAILGVVYWLPWTEVMRRE